MKIDDQQHIFIRYGHEAWPHTWRDENRYLQPHFHTRFLAIYFLSRVGGALAQIFVFPGVLVGASGALYGVLSCLALIAPEIRVLIFFAIPLSIRWAVVLFALIDFLMMGSADSIAHLAHISGLFVGLAFGYFLKGQPRYYHFG